jgi:methyl-accepting chemotaxis protein
VNLSSLYWQAGGQILIRNIQNEVQQSVENVAKSTVMIAEQEVAAVNTRECFATIRNDVETITCQIENIAAGTQLIVFKAKDIDAIIGELAAAAQQSAAES